MLKSNYINPYTELENITYSILETYSNIHRGTGHFSLVTTYLFEKARKIILDHLKLNKKKFIVIFSTPRRSRILKKFFNSNITTILSSHDFGLPIGIRAIVVKRSAVSKLKIFDTGGGTIKFVSPSSEIWSDIPERFEAGTPSIVNIISFAKAVQMISNTGKNLFSTVPKKEIRVKDLFDNTPELHGQDMIHYLRKSHIGNEIRIPTENGLRRYTNLDNGASTPTFFPIWEVYGKTLNSNTKSRSEIVEMVKKICAESLGAPLGDYEIIFTQNTTEAINILTSIIKKNLPNGRESIVVNSLLDHHSNELPWRYTPGLSLLRMSVDEEGFINLEELEKILSNFNQKHLYGKKRVILVSVCGASNVLGTFNNLVQISQITHKYGAYLFVDGAQLVAHREISLSKVGIDFFAFSGHKIYAPFGAGALIIKKNLFPLKNKFIKDFKSEGEENIVGIATMGKALSLLKQVGYDKIEEEEMRLTRLALDGLNKISNIEIFGIKDINSENFLMRGGVISFSLKNVPHNIVARELAEYGGIGVRNGCFCAHLLVKKLIGIHPIRQFFAKLYMMFIPTLGSIYLPGLVRISIGLENDENDIKFFLKILNDISARKRAKILEFLGSTHSGSGFRPHPLVSNQIKKFIQNSIKKVYNVGNG